MGTEILRPHNYFVERIRVSPCRRKNYNYNNNYSYYNTNQQQQQQQQPKYYDYSNPRPNRKPAVRSERTDQRKRQAEPPAPASKRSSSSDDLKISRNHNNNHNHGNKGASQNLSMEKVSILRRGESLDSKIKSMETAAPSMKDDQAGYMVVTGTDRLGPDPGMVPKQVRIAEFRSPVAGNCDMYAGSGFAVSPAPSSLPLPSFSKKKHLAVDDSATRDLRRLLRLDF
ncbi:uncharacterized protein [Euphorbia lathyris]|uniref:uncharacterized protein n=1 Tax=Euphorbia lathyris TaxID=212925 RepID=UPI003313F1A2